MKEKKAFLITAIGSFSANAVIQSIRKNYPKAIIIGTDIHDPSWILSSNQLDFTYQVPKANHSDYLPTIIQLIEKHNIHFLIPLTDPEVDVMSIHHDTLKTYTILTVSNNQTIPICRNKYLMADFFLPIEGVTPIETHQYDSNKTIDLSFPFIAKKINGRSSEGLKLIHSVADFCHLNSEYILQPLISGDVITVDVVVDDWNSFVCLARKELIRTSNGAGLSVEVFESTQIYKTVEKIVQNLEIKGAVNIEFIESNGIFYLMDMNPRFSAGIGFSQLAGFDIVQNHVRAFEGKKLVHPENIQYGLYSSNFTQIKI